MCHFGGTRFKYPALCNTFYYLLRPRLPPFFVSCFSWLLVPAYSLWCFPFESLWLECKCRAVCRELVGQMPAGAGAGLCPDRRPPLCPLCSRSSRASPTSTSSLAICRYEPPLPPLHAFLSRRTVRSGCWWPGCFTL